MQTRTVYSVRVNVKMTGTCLLGSVELVSQLFREIIVNFFKIPNLIRQNWYYKKLGQA